MKPCASFRPLAWDASRCVCGNMLEAHAVQPVAAVSTGDISIHVYQDRVGGESLIAGLDVEHRAGEPVIVMAYDADRHAVDDPDRRVLTFAQAEQLRDALTMILVREPVKQDPVADAAEDELYRTAVERMNAAEAREDAAEKARK